MAESKTHLSITSLEKNKTLPKHSDPKSGISVLKKLQVKETEDNHFESEYISDVPNKKKEGVSGRSNESSKLKIASDIQLPKYEKDIESEEFIKNAIRGNEFLKEGLFSCKDVIQAVVDAMYLKSICANTNVIREGEVGELQLLGSPNQIP